MFVQKSFQQHKVGSLYIVGTPIGNLQDMSDRAKEILNLVDLIAAEDTRHTKKLLNHFKIQTPLVSYHEHNYKGRGKELLERLVEGLSIALVSDAGLPVISDPGEQLVKEASIQEIPIIPIPGPNAALTTLVASGLPSHPFCFIGFLSRSRKERMNKLKQWSNLPATLIFYEAPHRLLSMLQDCLEVLGNRQVAIARELTKKNEEWFRGWLDEGIAHIDEKGVRGEYTVVVEGAPLESETSNEQKEWFNWTIIQHVNHYIEKGYSKKEAFQLVAKERGLAKRDVYNDYVKGE